MLVEHYYLMSLGPQSYEYYLLRYAEVYLLIGKLELTLRSKVITTLSNYSQQSGYSEWYEVVPKTVRNNQVIISAKNASAREKTGLELFIPFSFWRHLFRREYFLRLWVPCLHTAFSGLQNAVSLENYKVVCRKMKRANNIRNRVAHFNLTNAGAHDEEIDVLTWLISALGK